MTTPQIDAAGSIVRRTLSMLLALERVLSPSAFPYASNDHLFRDAHFGRDSLEVAEDLLHIRPDIARAVIARLAELQGRRLDPASEEEPGKIHHEYRAIVMDGREIGPQSRDILRQLAKHWEVAGSDEELDCVTEVAYFGTVDATPLYVRLVARYCALYGRGILDEMYVARRPTEGASRALLRESVRAAVDWIADRIEHSGVHLLEFQRMTPHGHSFQAWKDGGTSYLHPTGELANYLAPIASIEVQGLAYDALMAAPDLVPDAPAGERARWQSLAESVQQSVVERFWMPDEKYFAMALDRDGATGDLRQVRLISSNPGALLDSGIFDTLDDERRRTFVGAIVDRIYSAEFLAPSGIRVTSQIHEDIPGYPAYQSSYTTWHKETYDVAKGLRRQGFPRLACDLETRLLNAINITGGATEFLYVMPENRVDYNPLDNRPGEGTEEIAGTNVPEKDQAWSISAALAVKWRCGHPAPTGGPTEEWEAALEDAKLRHFPPTQPLRTIEGIVRARLAADRFYINTEAGWTREREFRATRDLR